MFISKNLLVFIITAQEGSLTNAANRLFTTPPPMSRSLKILEGKLGFKLFDRTAHGLRLTLKGTALYKEVYPIYTYLTELSEDYKKCKNGIINIGTCEVKSEYAGFICDYFVKNKNFNIELKENIKYENQSDIIISSKKIKRVNFDVELSATCKANLQYASHLEALSNYPQCLKELPFIQSAIFSSTNCFNEFIFILKQQGFKGRILNIDDKTTRYNLIKKGAGISITTKGFFPDEKPEHLSGLCIDNNTSFDATYYIYLKSSVIDKDLFIQHVRENSPLLWQEVNESH
ncbi:LysR family transcriptional regulator [Yersinia bercovieri]|uniref:LysR family transcriptional regulator n=1 Tax=Yersinia bercovieri TaxID=634 RepID=UPI0011AB599B|nr:LysR family transcriptional regulator [Yersinia bercovieri]